MNKFRKVSYIIHPPDKDLNHALFRKFDITEHPDYLAYDKVLYLDCDILVQDNIVKLFDNVETKPGKLYVVKEGDIEGPYWRSNAYAPGNVEKMRKDGVHSFNAGTFLFAPSEEMRHHFKCAKDFGLYKYKGRHFYDQSTFNYYFNVRRIAEVSPYLNRKVKMFPDINTFYPTKMILHLAGIGDYKMKTRRMKKYQALIRQNKMKLSK
jgi:lipopolysaccharide biosynthesis glycosyltransferase